MYVSNGKFHPELQIEMKLNTFIGISQGKKERYDQIKNFLEINDS